MDVLASRLRVSLPDSLVPGWSVDVSGQSNAASLAATYDSPCGGRLTLTLDGLRAQRLRDCSGAASGYRLTLDDARLTVTAVSLRDFTGALAACEAFLAALRVYELPPPALATHRMRRRRQRLRQL